MSEEASINTRKNTTSYRITEKARGLAAAGILSKILGLIRDLAIASLFSRELTDAWALAFRGPHFFRRIFSEGAVAGVLVPEFQNKKSSQLRHFFYSSSLFWAALIAGVIISMFWRQEGASGSFLEAPREHLFVAMAFYLWSLWPIHFLLALSFAEKRFQKPALIPVVFNTSIVLALFVLADNWVWQLGWSLSVAGGLQLFFLYPEWRSLHNSATVPEVLPQASVRELSKKVLYALGRIGFHHWLGLAATFLAMSLGTGVVSYLFWADRLLEFPMSLVGGALGLAAIPSLSQAQQTLQLKKIWHEYYQESARWSVPASVGLFFFAKPLALLLFDWGSLTSQELRSIAEIFKWNSVLLLLFSFAKVINTVILSASPEEKIKSETFWCLGAYLVGGLILQKHADLSVGLLMFWTTLIAAIYLVYSARQVLQQFSTSLSLADFKINSSIWWGSVVLALWLEFAQWWRPQNSKLEVTIVIGFGVILYFGVMLFMKKSATSKCGTLG
ncbi:MAG: lipid II flippase MurJ [Bdellovibrionia bacterium]